MIIRGKVLFLKLHFRGGKHDGRTGGRVKIEQYSMLMQNRSKKDFFLSGYKSLFEAKIRSSSPEAKNV